MRIIVSDFCYKGKYVNRFATDIVEDDGSVCDLSDKSLHEFIVSILEKRINEDKGD